MSIQLLRDDTLAQLVNTLYGLSSLVGKGELPKPLSAALQKLIEFTPLDYSSMRLFSGLNGDIDPAKRHDAVAAMALGLSEANRQAYQKSHAGAEVPPAKLAEDWKPILAQHGSLISLAFVESGQSAEQSSMFRYFANQLTRLSENLGSHDFGVRLSSVLNDIAVASAEAAFSVHPAYHESSIERAVIADDLIQLSVNGQHLVVDNDGVSDALNLLSTAYTQGKSGHLVKVDGADMLTYLLANANHDEVKLPTFNTHSEIPFAVPTARDTSAVKYRQASDVGKPNDFSMLRVFRALDWVDLRYRNKQPDQLLKLNGAAFTQADKEHLLQTIRSVRSGLAWQYAQQTQPFPVETVYSQDLKAFKLRAIRSTPLYIMGDLNMMPASERLDELQVRLSESMPEVVFDVEKSLLPGVNNKKLDVKIMPKLGIDEASLYEMLTQHQDTRDRLISALQDLAGYAHAHDTQISFIAGPGMHEPLLRDLMVNVSTVNEIVAPDGHVKFESQKTNAVSVPNGQGDLMLVLQTPTKEFVSREMGRGHFIAFDDLSKAKAVLDNLVKYEPGASARLNLAKVMMRQQDLGYLKPELTNSPAAYLLDQAMISAINSHDDVWPVYSDEGRASVLVSECQRRGLLQDNEVATFSQSIKQRLDGKDGLQDAKNQVRAIRIDFMKQQRPEQDAKIDTASLQQVAPAVSGPGMRR